MYQNEPVPETIYSICFTSGTTGPPKPVIITHRMMLECSYGLVDHGLHLTVADSYLSCIPLTSMMERIILHTLITSGAKIGFYSRDIHFMREDMAILKPTIIVASPKFYNNFYKQVLH